MSFFCRRDVLSFFYGRRYIGGLFSSSSIARGAAGGAVKGENPSLGTHFMVGYLVKSWGLSAAEASEAAKSLSHLKSTKRPDAFLGFFKRRGFSNAHLRKIVTRYPRFICVDAEEKLAPNFRFFEDLGLSESDLNRSFFSHPQVFSLNLHQVIQPRVEFWTRLLRSEKHLVNILKYNARFLASRIERTAVPNLLLLRGCGISDQKLALVLRKTPAFILRSQEKLRALIERVEGMGIPRSSGMFLWALWAVSVLSEAKFNAKRRLMKSLGWSEDEFFAAFRKSPVFVTNSEEMLSEKMTFLVKEVGYEPSEVALSPWLLMCSLEKRLVPRHRVMQMLNASGLHHGKYQFSSIMRHSKKIFMSKFVIPHKDKVSGLLEMYVDACGNGDTN